MSSNFIQREISSSASSNKRLGLLDPSSVTPRASTSSSSIQNRFKYDVFISFRGEETRNTFVGHLYQALKDKGISTYQDDEKIKQGKPIDNQLIQSIKDSRFFIIVFSKNYAASSWCLDELVEIMGCQKTGKQTAYPVFFDVEPTQVRKQSGAVKEAFAENENKEATGKWREAMKEASHLAGWELKATTNGNWNRFAVIGTENPVHGYSELSRKVVRYAAGLPLTIKVLGSFLCGKDMDHWKDAIERLRDIPLKETLEKLELSYISLEDEYKEIFLDVACILKGQIKEDAIRILECCGNHARNGLKVLEQRSLITIFPKWGYLVVGMHDHIEEMGKNIVRREHPNEPNKHSRLWIKEEIKDILANDMCTEETRYLRLGMLRGNLRCLRLGVLRGNSGILSKGLGKMKKLVYLQLGWDYDEELGECTQNFPNSLKYLKCWNYPFLYLPKTFEGNNLVGLEMRRSRRMVQLWKKREKKVLKNLKFLTLSESRLMTFDFKITPNLETLSLIRSYDLKELFMPVCCQKLKHLDIGYSKLRTFDLGLTPNLETLALYECYFEELKVSAPCPNLKSLDLSHSNLRILDLELIPNLARLHLKYSPKLIEINAPIGCLKKVVHLNLHGCVLLEKLPEDLGRFGCLKELDIIDTRISHLPQSIFGLKGLLIAASLELLQLYDFPSQIRITTESPWWWDIFKLK